MRSVQGTGMKRLFQVTTALSCSTSYRSRNSVASLVIGIWAGHQSRHVSIPDMDKRFISSPKRPDWLQSGAVQWVQRGFPRGRNGCRLRLSAYVPPVPELRKSRAITHSPTRLPIMHMDNVTFILFRYLCPGISSFPDWRFFNFYSNVTEYG